MCHRIFQHVRVIFTTKNWFLLEGADCLLNHQLLMKQFYDEI